MTTPKYYLYFPKNRYFVKRQNELNELNQKLPRDQDCQKLTILGLGGTGKTQVALQFAYLVKETQPEWSVFWVSALSMDSFDRTCLKIAQELKIPQAADQEEDVKELVKQYLSSNKAGRWLLVVDNADDPDIFFGTRRLEGIHGYLPESDGGVIVYTTRTPEVAELTCGDVLEVGVMDHQDAIIFLTKSLTRKTLLSNVAIANELLKELTYLPLAIAQAAAYLNKNRMPVAKYLRLLRNTENDIVSLMSREFRDNTRYKESANAVADTWIVSFSQIREHHKVAADLLAFMSCIEWKAIPRSLLPCMQSEVEMEDAIGTLCGYSFLTKRSDDTRDDDAQEFREESDESVGEEEGWYDIYRLVHLATNICVSEHGTAATVTEEAVRHVTEVFPWDEYESREVWRMYLPHTLRLLGSSRDYSSEQKSKLCLKVGRCLQLDGKIRDAVTWLEESCRLRDGLDEANQDRLNAQHVLARAYQEDGHMQEAVELLEHIVGVDGKLLDGNDSDRLASQHALAVAYYADGHVQMATKLLEHVVRVREVLAKEHPSQQASQHNLAIAYKADGRLQKAMELMEHVVAVEARTLRDDHPSRVVSAEMLADWYADLAVE
jgi:tetratricopeptide (TPR) repeat protein